MTFSLGQGSEYQGDNYWRWWVWLDGTDEQLDRVARVVYALHPTFANPVRTITDRESKFRLETAGWGVFRIHATVVYTDGTQELVEHDLTLSYPETDPTTGERPQPSPAQPALKLSQAELEAPAVVQGTADGVFEGGAVSPIAMAGALVAAEEVGGVGRWVNVVGSSGGALVAALLAVGYSPSELVTVFREARYGRFLDVGPWGMIGGAIHLILHRGMAPGTYLTEWLRQRFEEKLGTPDPTFADVVHPEYADSLSPAMKYRLRLIASDITSGRMIVLPDDIEDYEHEDGRPFRRDDLPLADAVRMSMSIPFVFSPVTLYRSGRPYHIVDGRLLSTFPIWIFDSPNPRRPTWGFHVHGGSEINRVPYRRLSRKLSVVPLTQAMIVAVAESWDTRYLSKATAVRTVSIETGDIRSNEFLASAAQLETLYQLGYDAARDFYGPAREYVNSFGVSAEGTGLVSFAS